MTHRWTVQDAKARLSEILSRARKGEPQRIGLEESCIVISEADWLARQDSALGSWLVETAPHGAPLAEAARASRRGDPFEAKPKARQGRTRKD